MIELREQSAVAPPGTSLGEFETYCGICAIDQRAANWRLGDLALAVERQHPQTFNQAWPTWVSPDLIARCKAVAAAYKPEERNILANWTIHSQNAKRPDRVAIVAAHVEAGHTSDEARKTPVEAAPPVVETPPVAETPPAAATDTSWLLAVDVNGGLCSHFFGGAWETAAAQYDEWLGKLITRLQKDKGLTDVVCCMDSSTNFRKELTKDWEHPYKASRKPKEQQLYEQLRIIPDLLRARGLAVVSLDGFEADDLIASYAVQFPGRVTIVSIDKDMRQCLSSKCNILLAVAWEENTETGDRLPVYKWVSAKSHTEETGLRPDQWVCKQILFGDTVDNIKGAANIGDVGATKLVVEFGSAQAAMEAAKRMDSRLLSMTRGKIMSEGLLDLEERFEITRQLVALRVDLNVPQITRI